VVGVRRHTDSHPAEVRGFAQAGALAPDLCKFWTSGGGSRFRICRRTLQHDPHGSSSSRSTAPDDHIPDPPTRTRVDAARRSPDLVTVVFHQNEGRSATGAASWAVPSPGTRNPNHRRLAPSQYDAGTVAGEKQYAA